jgi:tRNA U54 and U55 pseudouridine synthase Pus10
MTDILDDKNILETVEKILPEYCLCDSCLGRLFSKAKKGVSNEEIGSFLRKKTGFNKKNKA